MANQRDESARAQHAQGNTLAGAEDTDQLLLVAVAHGHDHAPADDFYSNPAPGHQLASVSPYRDAQAVSQTARG